MTAENESPTFSTPAFAQKWTQIYILLDSLGYLDSDYSEKHINYPHHASLSPAPTNPVLNLDSKVLEVIKSIPCPATTEFESICLFPLTRPLCYLDPDSTVLQRNVAAYYFGETRDGVAAADLPRDEVALTTAAEDGTILVLNVTRGTIREIDSGDLDMQGFGPYPAHSRVRGAMEVVEEYLGKLRGLEWVPGCCDLGDDGVVGDGEGDAYIRDKMRKALIEDYGWPDDFRLEDWKRERHRLYRMALGESLKEES